MISGGDKGGAKTAVFSLLMALGEKIDITVACFTEGVFYQEVQELPVKSVLFKQRFRYDLTILRRLARYIRAEGFDIVHAHGARANFICSILKPFVKVPYVTTIHSDYKLDFTDKLYKKIVYTALNVMALKRMDYYIGVSDAFRGMLVERGFDTGRVFSVHNVVEAERAKDFVPKAEFLARFGLDGAGRRLSSAAFSDSGGQPILVGIIGRFDHVKGHDIFLRAAAEICKRRDDVRFLLAGEGSEEANLRKMVRTLGIAERVVFCGFVTDIFSFINAIDINVCASRSESFAYMLHEGALMKKPAVSTHVGGIGELIIDGQTGTLVPDGDFRALAASIENYIENPALGAKHGAALYDHAVTFFSKERMQARSLEIYQTILTEEKRTHRVFDVMLHGYYGYANSGDDALLDAVLKSLRAERSDLSILVLSRAPADTMRDYGVFSIYRYNLRKVRKYMKRTRLIVYGGGSHIQDITSTRSLMYYTLLLHWAKRLGMRAMLYGNGIGPITGVRNIVRARRALEVCDYVSLRDPESYAFVKRMGVVNPNVAVSVDPVFALDAPGASAQDAQIATGGNLPSTDFPLQETYTRSPDFPKLNAAGVMQSAAFGIPDASGNAGYFAVSLRPWPHNAPHFVETIANVINHTSATYGLVPILIPMQLDNPNDLTILRSVARLLHGDYVLLPRVFRYDEIMDVLAHATFAMCMRLHALIYAVGVGVPIIGLVYDPKVANFVAYMNQDAVMDTSAPDEATLQGMIAAIMDNPQAAREKITHERKRLRALAANDAKIAVGLL